MDFPPVPPAPDNPLLSLEDIQRALIHAAALGFADNVNPKAELRPHRSGPWVAARLCLPGSFTRMEAMWLKGAYLAGYSMAAKKSSSGKHRRRKG